MEALRRWLFPKQTRHLQGARAFSITFRTLHMIGFGALLGGHAFTVDTDRLLPCLWLAILSGFGLIALKLHAEGLAGGLTNRPPTAGSVRPELRRPYCRIYASLSILTAPPGFRRLAEAPIRCVRKEYGSQPDGLAFHVQV